MGVEGASESGIRVSLPPPRTDPGPCAAGKGPGELAVDCAVERKCSWVGSCLSGAWKRDARPEMIAYSAY